MDYLSYIERFRALETEAQALAVASRSGAPSLAGQEQYMVQADQLHRRHQQLSNHLNNDPAHSRSMRLQVLDARVFAAVMAAHGAIFRRAAGRE